MFIATLYGRNQGKLSAMEVWVRKIWWMYSMKYHAAVRIGWMNTFMDAKKECFMLKLES